MPPSCGDNPVERARSLRKSASNRVRALECFILGAGTDPAVHYEAASLAYELGDTDRLFWALRGAIRLAPFFGDGYFELGNALTSSGRPHEAIASYKSAIDTAQVSDMPMTMNNLGNAMADAGDHDGAMATFRRGLKLAPTFTYLHNGLANVLSTHSRDTEAVVTLRRALRSEPSAHYCRYNLGHALRRLKREDEAERAFVRALEAVPSDWRYIQGLGQLRHETHRLSEATFLYGAAQRQLASGGLPRSAPLERDTASALREAKRFPEAEVAARRVLALQPDNPDSYAVLKDVLKEANRLEESAHYHQREADYDVLTKAASAPQGSATRWRPR